jgi:integrase
MATSRAAYGDGTIFEKVYKSGRKVFVVEMVVGRLPNGKPRKIRRTANSRKDALQIRQKLNAEKNAGRLTTKNIQTVETYGKWWVREVKPMSIKDSTAADYEDRLRRYVFPYLGKVRLSELSYQNVIDWMSNLLYAQKSVRTINGARAILHALCIDAQRAGIMGSNPVSLSKPFKSRMGDKTQVQPHWTKEEAISVLKIAKDSPLDLFIYVCIHMGVRHGEALGLSWSSVDLENRTITIKQTLKDERRLLPSGDGQVRSRLQEVKTKSSNRVLRMPDPVFDSFSRHQMQQSTMKMLAGPAWRESGMVFTSSIGSPINMANNLKRYKRFLAQNSIRYIRVHDIRHTYASLALENSVPLEAISQSLGHADIGITKKIYAPNVKGLNEVAIDGLANYLKDETYVPVSWSSGIEEVTPSPLEIVAPVKISSRRVPARIPSKPGVTA